MKNRHPICACALVLAGVLTLSGTSALAAEEKLPDMLAAQIRLQGFACDKALGVTTDAKRSRPDRGVWVLRCSNATFRVSRAPDMAAKVQPLR